MQANQTSASLPFRLNAVILFVVFIALLLLSCNRSKPLPPGDKDNGGLFLPGNFEAVVVADSIGRARHMAVNDNGDVYVKLTYNDIMHGYGGTVALRDENNDGKADIIAYIGNYKDEGGLPAGIRIYDGYLYTTTVKYIFRNKLINGSLLPDKATDTIFTDTDTALFRHWHSAKPITFDNNGNMYVPFGAPDDAAQDVKIAGAAGIPNGKGVDPAPELENHAGIWKFDANKKYQTQKDGYQYATGLRSILAIAWNDKDHNLYAAVNGMDNFHTRYPDRYTPWQAAMLPSEIFTKVKEHGNYGWPYGYYDQLQGKNILQPGYGGDGKITGRAASFDLPIIGFPGHWAPMDLLFYKGSQFPEHYKDGAFIAFHGSTDRSPYPQAGYIVCFVPFKDGQATTNWELFADGFTGVDTVVNTSDAKYRPMGLAEGPDGSLYITESNKGRIWRVMYKGDKKNFTSQQLASMESRKSRTYIKTPDEVKDNMGKGGDMAGLILYNSYCVSCHQRDGKGDNNRYPPLLGSNWIAGGSDTLINIILNGLQKEIVVNGKTFNGVMPAHGGFLDDHAVASIATYVKIRFNKEKINITSAEVSKIRAATSLKK